jgi:hypothetical protein
VFVPPPPPGSPLQRVKNGSQNCPGAHWGAGVKVGVRAGGRRVGVPGVRVNVGVTVGVCVSVGDRVRVAEGDGSDALVAVGVWNTTTMGISDNPTTPMSTALLCTQPLLPSRNSILSQSDSGDRARTRNEPVFGPTSASICESTLGPLRSTTLSSLRVPIGGVNSVGARVIVTVGEAIDAGAER